MPLHRVGLRHTQYRPRPGWVEQDPEEIFSNTMHAIVRVVRESGAEPGRIRALGIANQRQTVLVWDGKTGEALGRALVRQDERGSEMCDRLSSEGSRALVKECTRHSDVLPEELRVDGGASSNRFLMQFQADILDMQLRVSARDDISARGVAFMAGVACGVWRNQEVLSSFAVPERSYYPKMGAAGRRALLEGWRKAVPQAIR